MPATKKPTKTKKNCVVIPDGVGPTTQKRAPRFPPGRVGDRAFMAAVEQRLKAKPERLPIDVRKALAAAFALGMQDSGFHVRLKDLHDALRNLDWKRASREGGI